ncbi:Ceramidase [Aquimixticola soesokkakensis]|uniref:Ceramidase n=1 Tax=Aquimixticola soesokkakensis TaxID=1519096 RepID=A0A1Y5T9N3_9RHOB|nr:ceramidase domain-containing protein [Aquimixticola soesokkakensis]SLN58800.1 Ceramidase [Aquimixticola soesokkakensis]
MNWTSQVDEYCERIDFTFWSEPLNALTNLAFILAAVLVWRQARGKGRLLTAVLFVIGCGSFAFHTFATRWASMADVLPILAFILCYLFAANRDFLGLSNVKATLATLAFFPFAALTVPLFSMLPIGASAGYAPVPVLLLGYAFVLRRSAPQTARGLTIGAALLLISLTFRTLDGPLCANWPSGTHFLWHILNATLLGWLILVHARQQSASNT